MLDLSRVKHSVRRQLCDDCGLVKRLLYPFAVSKLTGRFSLVCSGCREKNLYDRYVKNWPGQDKTYMRPGA